MNRHASSLSLQPQQKVFRIFSSNIEIKLTMDAILSTLVSNLQRTILTMSDNGFNRNNRKWLRQNFAEFGTFKQRKWKTWKKSGISQG